MTWSTLILVHVVTGLAGIAAGLTAIGGMFCGRRLAWVNAIFLLMTAEACATGFVFLPTKTAGSIRRRCRCWWTRRS